MKRLQVQLGFQRGIYEEISKNSVSKAALSSLIFWVERHAQFITSRCESEDKFLNPLMFVEAWSCRGQLNVCSLVIVL